MTWISAAFAFWLSSSSLNSFNILVEEFSWRLMILTCLIGLWLMQLKVSSSSKVYVAEETLLRGELLALKAPLFKDNLLLVALRAGDCGICRGILCEITLNSSYIGWLTGATSRNCLRFMGAGEYLKVFLVWVFNYFPPALPTESRREVYQLLALLVVGISALARSSCKRPDWRRCWVGLSLL